MTAQSAAPLRDRLEREPTDAAAGRATSPALTLSWDLAAVTVSATGAATRTLRFEDCALQVSRARLAPAPSLWQRVLGQTPPPRDHLVVELRPHTDPRCVLCAAAPDSLLAGLPRLQPGAQRLSASLEGLLALVDAARAGGASLVHAVAEPDAPSLGEAGAVLPFGLRPAVWLRVAIALAAALVALVCFVEGGLPHFTRAWREGDRAHVLLLVAVFFVPGGVLARRAALRLREGARAHAIAWGALTAVLLLLTASFALSLAMADMGRRDEQALGAIVAMQTAAWFGAPLLGAWHGVELDALGLSLRRFGRVRRRILWRDTQPLHDALFAPPMRFVQSPAMLALVLRVSRAEPPASVLAGAQDDHAAEVAWPGELVELAELPRRDRAVAGVIAICVGLMLVPMANAALPSDAERWALLPVALLGALGAKLLLWRGTVLLDLHFGLVLLRHSGLWPAAAASPGDTLARLALPPGAWLEGCSLLHVATARAIEHESRNALDLAPQAGSAQLLRRRGLHQPLATELDFQATAALARRLEAHLRQLELEQRPQEPPRPLRELYRG